ncbi:hypothetical protein JQ615_00615 [Bradyrhizobium jicamae]|uniref:Uncharacterized protein n=1 Tax=Bradyrhizobium jicamae TaxID=280332 RepID=A0ABS5FAS9_9BRAD|nr:hypothetical protein [Bradyrhizobium jicamae]MBR0793883.1 hypothetical protein [Bradyrhizobium jicamae]MBR0933345.1 hypothetical protein [Bradyrhizobium jicamae]
MRKLFLISAFVLASAAAQAGQSRGLVLAANDTPAPAQAAETTKPADPAPASEAQTTQGQVQGDVQALPAQPQAAPAETPKRYTAKPVKKARARYYESDEAKARRIAARYGIYW